MIRALILMLAMSSAFAQEMIYVVNSLDESLGWINRNTLEFEANAVTLGYIPNDVVATPDYLCVVNSGNNNVQVIDRESFETLRLIELEDAANPWGAASLRDGRLAVTATLSGTLSIVNAHLGTVDTTFYVGTAPQYVYELYNQIYVLCTGVEFPVFNPGVMKRYSSETFALVDSIVVGVNPQSAAFISVGYFKAHVLCTGNYDNIDGSLYVVNMEGPMVLETVIHLGGAPGAIAAGNGAGWIAAGGWDTEGYLYRYNPYTLEILNGFDNPIITGVGATDVAQEGHVSGGLAVSCFGANTVEWRDMNGDLGITFPMGYGPSAIDVWSGSYSTPPDNIPYPAKVELVSAYPNPFNGTVNLEWAGVLRSANQIQIFDVLGRKVGELAVGAGENSVAWVPGAGGGQEVAAGVYFARFHSTHASQPIRIVYVK